MKEKLFSIADYLMLRLKEAGVDHLFGVVGDFSLGLLRRACKSPVKMVYSCNELNAAYSADGYARVRGMGGLITTYVVGELSAINGIAGAFAENIPVIHVVGCPALKHYQNQTLLHHTLGDYEIPLRIYREVTVAAEILKDHSLAPATIDRVIQACLFRQKPVYLGIPADLVIAPCKRPSSRLVVPKRTSMFDKDLTQAVQDAVRILKKSKRPIVLIDFETVCFHLQKEVKALIEKSGFPFATMMLSKTCLDESHPQYIGTYSGNRSEKEVQKRVEESDGVLALGLKLTDFNSGGFTVQLPDQTIHGSMGSVLIGNHIYDGVDLRDFILAITRQIPRRDPSSFPFQKAHDHPAFKKALSYSPRKDKPITIQRFFDRMISYLNEDTIAIAETGSALFATAERTFQKGTKLIMQTFFGSIGYTVGATLGVSVGAPDKRVVLFVGDGSFQLTCQEVSTIIRQKLNPIIFLLNNDGYLVERVIGDGQFNDIQPWRYAQVPEIFSGGWGTKVETEEALEKALVTAWKNKGVSLIEVILDKWDSPPSMTQAGAAMAKNNFIID